MTPTIRRPLPKVALAFAAVAFLAGPIGAPDAAVAADRASVEREIVVDDLEVEHTINTCDGAEGTFSRTFTGFLQTTTRPDGTTLVRGWLNADDARFVPDDPTEPAFAGRELINVSAVSDSASLSTTFLLHLWVTGSDGSRAVFTEVEHLTIDSVGNTVEFEKPVVICGSA